MDALVFDAHHYDPQWIIPLYWQANIAGADEVIDQVPCFVAVLFYCCRCGPVVAFVVEIIP